MTVRGVILIGLCAVFAVAFDAGEMLLEPVNARASRKHDQTGREHHDVRGYLPSAATEGRPRQPEFGDYFHDVYDYIDASTYAIWEKHDVGLVRDIYADNCTAHTLEGQISGHEQVVKGTMSMLTAFPDRTLFPEGIAWSQYADGRYATSHLISSKMTNRGESPFGSATGRAARIRVIAHCIIKGHQIVNEWLVRDNYELAVQIGKDPMQVAKTWAKTQYTDTHKTWLGQEFARVQAHPSRGGPTAPAEVLSTARKLLKMWSQQGPSVIHELYHPHAVFQGPAGRDLIGPDDIWSQYYRKIHSTLENFTLSLEHVAANTRIAPESSALERGVVAVQWTIVGKHSMEGLWGAPSGAPVVILGETHWEFANGLIVQETTIFDELSVMAQIEHARMQKQTYWPSPLSESAEAALPRSSVFFVFSFLVGIGATFGVLRRRRTSATLGTFAEQFFDTQPEFYKLGLLR